MELVDSFENQARLKVFHISSDYARQRLYGEMIAHLAAINIEQFVYVPVRSAGEINCNRVSGLNEVQYLYSHILRKFHRIFFRLKVRTIVKDLLKCTSISHYSLMHAHFLYSDGAVARRVQKITGLPYIVAVRNTDVNVFMRLRPDLQWICWDILRHASRIVFMTPSYFQLMRQRVPADVRVILKKKAVIIPNGLNHFWLDDTGALERPERGCPLCLLCVGDFSRNKNIIGVMKAARIVNTRLAVNLTLIGGGGNDEAQVDSLLASGEWSFVKKVGRVECREKLREIYLAHDILVMPSFFETFGLVYIEALSQGVPVVHSRGQGVDGYFSAGTVAEAVDPTKPDSIADGILALSNRLPDIRAECIKAAKRFGWNEVAHVYQNIYHETGNSILISDLK